MEGRSSVVEVEPAVVVEIAEVRTHIALFHPIWGEGGIRGESNLFKPSFSEVVIEEIRAQIVRDEDVGPAVVIVVRDHDSQTVELIRINPQLGSSIMKVTFAISEVDGVALPRQPAGTAKNGNAPVVAGRVVYRQMVQGILKIVAHIQVQMTVPVEIGKSRAHAPTAAFDAGFFRNLFKRSVMTVVK